MSISVGLRICTVRKIPGSRRSMLSPKVQAQEGDEYSELKISFEHF